MASVLGVIEAGTPRLGLWCEHCLLPSRFEVEVLLLGDDGKGDFGISSFGIYSECTDCGRQP